MRPRTLLALQALTLLTLLCVAPQLRAEPPVRTTGPWNMEALKKPPQATWGETKGLVREVFYEGEPYKGKPTRIFAYYGRPKEGAGPFPAMVLVHGGGGQAFAEWANLWAERGYVALAMDTAGHGPGRKRLEDGGPNQGDDEKFRKFTDDDARDMWTYHAVAAVVRGHSFLAAQPEVDREKIGITGISWGGYLTCIVTGIDDRLKVSVPVYGCGHLAENSTWLSQFERMSAEQRTRWTKTFDPGQYLPGVSCPILFMNGTNDFAYPLDSYQKSYRDVKVPIDLCVTVRMPHGHTQGWAPKEIGLYVDSVLKGGVPLARLGKLETVEGQARASVVAKGPIAKGQLHYTTDGGAWQKREWKSLDATVKDGQVTGAIPAERPIVYFLTVTDDRGAVASSEHGELGK